MAEETHISWADATFNPWRGCTKVSEGCKFCYAETLSKRNMKVLGEWGPKVTRVAAAESYWKEPLKWNAQAEREGVRKRVFCASLADVFEGPETCQNPEAYAVIEAGRKRLFELIDRTPWLDWLLLTKRPENVTKFTPWGWGTVESYLQNCVGKEHNVFGGGTTIGNVSDVIRPNVWIGTSVENQKAADERIPHLLQIPSKVRFLSCEPLLGPVNFSLMNGRADCAQRLGRPALEGIHWVIAGGESGPNARPMHPDWARSLRDQCVAAGVAFHFKQWGEWVEREYGSETGGVSCAVVTHTGEVYLHPTTNALNCPAFLARVGKKNAGRVLDGRTWDELPEVAR